MGILKKPVFRFFYPEMLWIFVACISALFPFEEKTNKIFSSAKNEVVMDDPDIKKDIRFIINASEGGLMEIKLGELALSNAASSEVKKIGKIMVEDHTKINKELNILAQGKKIALPAIVSKKQQMKYNDLAKKTGADFDEIYISCMISDHKKDIFEFEKEAEKGKDLEIKNWAANKIPVLKHHLHLAKEASISLKKEMTIKNK